MYVAPTAIEGRLKAACPYLSNVIVHGDRRPYCTALVSLDPEAIATWAADRGLGALSHQQLAGHPMVIDLIAGYVDEANGKLARHETIKAFSILRVDLSIDAGEVTPSLKVRRRVVEAHCKLVLDAMY